MTSILWALLQITGNFSAVKKALFSISSSLQENGMHSQVDPFPPWGYTSGLHAADYHSRGYPSNPGHENAVVHNRVGLEEEVVFKLLCQVDKVGSLIGKGGSVIRALQCETGALIKIADTALDSDERIVVISALEAWELNCLSIILLYYFLESCYVLALVIGKLFAFGCLSPKSGTFYLICR